MFYKQRPFEATGWHFLDFECCLISWVLTTNKAEHAVQSYAAGIGGQRARGHMLWSWWGYAMLA